MDFDLSDEQVMLRDSVTRFLQAEYSAERRRRAAASSLGYDAAIWKSFAGAGWIGLPLSEDVGGIGGGAVDTMVMMECLGASAVIEPYLASAVLAGRLLDALGSAQQRQDWLPAVVAGEKTLALAFAEPDGRYEIASVRTTARAVEGGYALSGRKTLVLNGARADAVLVVARTAGTEFSPSGLSLFLVGADQVTVAQDCRNVDGSHAADLVFDDVRLAQQALVGTAGEAFGPLAAAIDFATLAVAAGAIGAMQAVNATTVDYLKTREQFGAVIGTFQALQHRVVDMTMALELARSLVMVAAIKTDENAPDAPALVSAAKSQVGRSGRFIGKNAVQLHGGIGVSQEYALGHYFKYLLASDLLLGDSSHHAARFKAAAA